MGHFMHVHGKVLEALMEESGHRSRTGEHRRSLAASRHHAVASGQTGYTGLAALTPWRWQLGVKSQPGFAWA